jgi:hypothetical protein
MSLKQMEAQAKAQCFDWNEKHPNGTMVSYESVMGSGETHRCRTNGKAFVSSCEAVIFIERVSGYVSLEHCTAVAAQPVPVIKITLEDRGQDFTEWYVRDGVVIDCQPNQGRFWVGTKVMSCADLVAGSTINVITLSGEETTLNYPVQAIETLSPDTSAEVEGYGRKWADMQGIAHAALGL